MAAWVKQLASQVAKHGTKKAAWYCEWDEPDGTRRMKSCGPGTKGKHLAQAKADKINAQLTLGEYDSNRQERDTWSDFFEKYSDMLTANSTSGKLRVGSVREMIVSLKHFSRILKLDDRPMIYITTERIDDFRTKRRTERGKNPGSTVSPATLNKDLRNIKAALRLAVDWTFLEEMPKIKFENAPEKLPTYITPEDFTKIYNACDVATMPEDCPAGPAAWWRALLVFGQMTGWRRGEMMALKWGDVDLDKCHAITRAAFNKGKRDEITPLHPVVIEHLRPLLALHDNVFAWSVCDEYLYDEFARIQVVAGIKLECPDKHFPWHGECSPGCHRYGFHDERRAFATLVGDGVSRKTLQKLMRHKSPLTTEGYINIREKLHPAIANLTVPAVLAIPAPTPAIR